MEGKRPTPSSCNFRTIRLKKKRSKLFREKKVTGNPQRTENKNGFFREILEGRRK